MLLAVRSRDDDDIALLQPWNDGIVEARRSSYRIEEEDRISARRLLEPLFGMQDIFIPWVTPFVSFCAWRSRTAYHGERKRDLMSVSNRSMAIAATVLALAGATPASAQMDISGEWANRYHEDQPERGPGPELRDYLGMPINAGARQRGDAHNSALLTVPEYQCRPHPADYQSRQSEFRITRTIDSVTQQVVSFNIRKRWQAQERTIWMDGRSHPPEYAAHTWQGFSTGEWVGNMLKVTTTHLKPSYIRRNGLPRSDTATLTEYFTKHGNFLTWVSIVNDPVYLTEPLVRSSDYALDPAQVIVAYPCQYVIEVDRPRGAVPHYLPGENPYIEEFATRHGLPLAAAAGGAETMYPEYARRLR